MPLEGAGLGFGSATRIVVGRMDITAAQADCAKHPPNEGHIHRPIAAKIIVRTCPA